MADWKDIGADLGLHNGCLTNFVSKFSSCSDPMWLFWIFSCQEGILNISPLGWVVTKKVVMFDPCIICLYVTYLSIDNSLILVFAGSCSMVIVIEDLGKFIPKKAVQQFLSWHIVWNSISFHAKFDIIWSLIGPNRSRKEEVMLIFLRVERNLILKAVLVQGIFVLDRVKRSTWSNIYSRSGYWLHWWING